MNIIITGRQIELTDAIKEKIESKLSKLENHIDQNTDVKVTVSAKKERQTIEVTIRTINGPVIRAEDTQEDLYAAIDLVTDKLKRQIRKYKKRLQDKKQDNMSIRFIERLKKFSLKPMTEEEAVLQMDLVGHDFYMFRNTDTDEIAVVYKRNNGGYGIIEHD